MSLVNFPKEKLQDKFDMFMFNLSDYLENFISKLDSKGYKLNYSISSLSVLQDYIINEKITINDDDVNDAGCYFGEVVRRNYGGKWICNLDNTKSVSYGKPVIIGHTKPQDLILSPIDSVLILIIRPRDNHFLEVIKNHID